MVHILIEAIILLEGLSERCAGEMKPPAPISQSIAA